MRRPVGGRRACSPRPGVTRQAGFYIQGGLSEHLPLVNGGTASNQDDRTAVRRGVSHVAEAGFQLGGAEMLHQDILAPTGPQPRPDFWVATWRATLEASDKKLRPQRAQVALSACCHRGKRGRISVVLHKTELVALGI